MFFGGYNGEFSKQNFANKSDILQQKSRKEIAIFFNHRNDNFASFIECVSCRKF